MIAFSIAIITLITLRKWLKPISNKKERFVDDSKKAGRTLNQYNWRSFRDSLLNKIKTVNMSVEFQEEMQNDLNRLGWKHTSQDIRKMQILYTVMYIVFSIVMLLVSLMIGILMVMLVPMVWNIPVNYVKKEIKARNDEFLNKLDELYNVIYNQYKRKNDEHLGNIVDAYFHTTSPLMKKELAIILRDIDSGEDYALRQLKLRIPHPTVMRFCDIITNNLEGVNNREVMENFYMELKTVRDRRRRKRNEERAKKLDLVNKALYAPFILLVLVYLLISTLSNF
jgi:Flp pilus assembly protein TadB